MSPDFYVNKTNTGKKEKKKNDKRRTKKVEGEKR